MVSPDGRTHLRHSALDAEQRDLADRHVTWTLGFVRVFSRRWPRQRDDLHSAALLGLCHAARSFDANRGVKFTSFAQDRILGEMKEYLRQSRLLGYRLAPRSEFAPQMCLLSEAVTSPGYHEDDPPDGLIDPGLPAGWEAESVDTVEALARTLPGRHRSVILLLYTQAGYETQAEVARTLGVHPARISQLHGEAIGMLRVNLGVWL